MTCSPKGLIANSSVAWEEVAQLGMRSAQIGCPDVRQEITKILWPPMVEDKQIEDKQIIRGMGPTLGQLLKAPKVTQRALAGFLAIVKSSYKSFGRVRAEEDAEWRRLALLDHPDILDGNDWSNLHEAWGDLLGTSNRMRSLTGELLGPASLGQRPVPNPNPEVALSQAFCSPLIG